MSDSASAPSNLPSESAYDAQTWVGREPLLQNSLRRLQGRWRILALVGGTGIGKSALAEHLVLERLAAESPPPQRLYLHCQQPDFGSSVLTLLNQLEIVIDPSNPQTPEQHFVQLLEKLRTTACLVHIDNLEILLNPPGQTPTVFQDTLWLNFLQQVLASRVFQSQFILTTQALPPELEAIGTRYYKYWHRQDVRGLSPSEQLELFHVSGVEPTPDTASTLLHLGADCGGNPSRIRAIAQTILSPPFNGNVQTYVQHQPSHG